MNLKIDDRENNINIEFFNEVSLSLVFNAVANAYAFKFYFNPQNEQHKII